MASVKIELPLDLSYLYEISDHDREFIYEMIMTIVKNTPEMIQDIEREGKAEKWHEVGRLMHKLKPSLLLLNIDGVSAHIRELEANAKAPRNIEMIPKQIAELRELCDLILKELNELIQSDQF
ncbi:Hpt domain-containing protein [Reichenbachiella carrageenanivorans]|uniref:Hpt domain-containing protein n=1 Tax=Reichenbachiella carrageenanivorans TaxID=2979869 RepID=A0ABY6CYY1_9BACT|nr:Hpt domain-containing protein [Reichenbachiella carrageenanivorans]UXX78028.1 Hpt domain-containing protein [Reichenbachiella carrageenanivorans]